MVTERPGLKPYRIFMLAGEASGDNLGSRLIAGLNALHPGITVEGIGGPAMIDAGLVSKFPMDRLSVMGLVEVLPRLPELMLMRRQVVQSVVSGDYDALLTIDSPDFGLGVARRVKRHGTNTRLVHYVSPTVWAWRPWRTRTIAASVDHVLALFPFELPILERSGIPCTHVGHPVSDLQVPPPELVKSVCRNVGLCPDSRTVLMLPGSRSGEARRHARIFANVAKDLADRDGGLEFLVVMTPDSEGPVMSGREEWPAGTHFFATGRQEATVDEQHRLALYSAAHAALAASGTVSLELAAMQTPMVIAYSLNPITAGLLSVMLNVDTVTLVNLVTGTNTISEHLGGRIGVEGLVVDMVEIIEKPGARNAQLEAFSQTMRHLSPSGESTGLYTARKFLEVIGKDRLDQHPSVL